MSTPDISSLNAFCNWMNAFIQPHMEDGLKLTEVDDGDGTFRIVDENGHTRAFYGQGTRDAIKRYMDKIPLKESTEDYHAEVKRWAK